MKLLKESQLGRYLVYATGEIVLVMIGILLALQVNNWNETRKTYNLETQMLREMKVGLESDLKDIIYNMQAHQDILDSQNILIDWLDDDRPYNDSLGYHFARVNNSTVFVSNDGPYETLKDLGIRLIQNDSLRDKILQVYDLDFDYYNDHVVMYNDFVFNSWQKVNEPYFEGTLFLFADSGNRMHPLDPEGIKGNNSYTYNLKSMAQLNSFYVNRIMSRAKRGATELIAMIEEELEKR